MRWLWLVGLVGLAGCVSTSLNGDAVPDAESVEAPPAEHRTLQAGSINWESASPWSGLILKDIQINGQKSVLVGDREIVGMARSNGVRYLAWSLDGTPTEEFASLLSRLPEPDFDDIGRSRHVIVKNRLGSEPGPRTHFSVESPHEFFVARETTESRGTSAIEFGEDGEIYTFLPRRNMRPFTLIASEGETKFGHWEGPVAAGQIGPINVLSVEYALDPINGHEVIRITATADSSIN